MDSLSLPLSTYRIWTELERDMDWQQNHEENGGDIDIVERGKEDVKSEVEIMFLTVRNLWTLFLIAKEHENYRGSHEIRQNYGELLLHRLWKEKSQKNQNKAKEKRADEQ